MVVSSRERERRQSARTRSGRSSAHSQLPHPTVRQRRHRQYKPARSASAAPRPPTSCVAVPVLQAHRLPLVVDQEGSHRRSMAADTTETYSAKVGTGLRACGTAAGLPGMSTPGTTMSGDSADRLVAARLVTALGSARIITVSNDIRQTGNASCILLHRFSLRIAYLTRFCLAARAAAARVRCAGPSASR
jgi:hypothetical protein